MVKLNLRPAGRGNRAPNGRGWGKPAMKKILFIATGGTIASAKTENGLTPAITSEELLAAVPEIRTMCTVDTVQPYSLDSTNMCWRQWVHLAQIIRDGYAQYDGFVITHGTDTMEETGYFLNLTLRCKKPVVLVGAMLPSTGLGADGPRNLYNAVLVASTKATAEQGVVVAMNNIVVGARDVLKSNTVQPDTFIAGNFGKVGTIFNNKVTYESKPLRKHTYQTPFKVDNLTKLPKVGIVYNHGGVEDVQVKALVNAGYEGIVNAGVGNGNIHKSIFPVLEKAAKNGIAVVRSSRVPTGATTKDAEVDDNKYGFVSSGTLNPQKARILLQLGLTKTHDYKKLQDYFDQY